MKALWHIIAIALSIATFANFSAAQSTAKHKGAPPSTAPAEDDQAAARNATDTFLSGLKIADLPEGKQMMIQEQWLTGEDSTGHYERPAYKDATTLFDGMFDTDVPGVKGYKRLLDMTAVSEAGTLSSVRYIMIAYKDQQTKSWKILFTGTGHQVDIDRRVEESEKLLHDDWGSPQSNYDLYGFFLSLAGRLVEAKKALMTALTANPTGKMDGGKQSALYRSRDQALLQVIAKVTGDTKP